MVEKSRDLQSAIRPGRSKNCHSEPLSKRFEGVRPKRDLDDRSWANEELRAGLRALTRGEIGIARDYHLFYLEELGWWWQAKTLRAELRRVVRRKKEEGDSSQI